MDKPIRHREPARGKLAGIRADAKAAKVVKDTGQNAPGYNPQGLGAAWSHNFLNQKPWHPANFRNQAKVYEAEQKAIKEQKDKAIAKQEFEAEQEYIKTLSYLSAEEQRKYKERQSVSFMYQKPPGMDAAISKGTAAAEAPAEAGPSSSNAPADKPAQHQHKQRDSNRSHVKDMLGAMAALQEQDRFEVKHVSGMGGRSPPRGGADVSAANQMFLTGSDDEPEQDTQGGAEVPDDTSLQKPSKRQKLREAEAFLRAAGLDPALVARQTSKEDKQKKSKKNHKHKKHSSKEPKHRHKQKDPADGD